MCVSWRGGGGLSSVPVSLVPVYATDSEKLTTIGVALSSVAGIKLGQLFEEKERQRKQLSMTAIKVGVVAT